MGEEGVEEARPTLEVELAFDDDEVVDIPPPKSVKYEELDSNSLFHSLDRT